MDKVTAKRAMPEYSSSIKMDNDAASDETEIPFD